MKNNTMIAVVGITVGLMAVVTSAENYTWVGGGNNEWTNPACWSPSTGFPANPADNAIISNASPMILANAGWGADTLTIISTANSGQIRYRANGTINVINTSNTVGASGFDVLSDAAGTLTLREWNDLGPTPTPCGYAGPSHTWMFTNAAQITYVGNATNTLVDAFDFSGATSMTLKRNGAVSPTSNGEVIRNGNVGGCLFVIGRNDNGTQTWTVPSDSHPLLWVETSWPTFAGIKKVGSGDVNMADVDWAVRLKDQHGALAIDGTEGSYKTAYLGTVNANSFAIDNKDSTSLRRFQMSGKLVLDGQGGRQGAAAGNGHAFSMVTSSNNLMVYLHTQGDPNSGGQNKGRLEVAPGGGDIFVNSTGSGLAWLEVSARSSQRNTNNPSLIGNTINLASTNAYLTDRSYESPSYAQGSVIVFRGDFINQSARTNEFRLDNSTLSCVTGGTNEASFFECPSKDIGASDPSTNNMAIGSLILGKSYDGSTAAVKFALRDNFTNNAGSVKAEAVYVTNLTMYASSALYLNGYNLYYKNSGSWVLAVPGPFAPGDGTGAIATYWPSRLSGTQIIIR